MIYFEKKNILWQNLNLNQIQTQLLDTQYTIDQTISYRLIGIFWKVLLFCFISLLLASSPMERF